MLSGCLPVEACCYVGAEPMLWALPSELPDGQWLIGSVGAVVRAQDRSLGDLEETIFQETREFQRRVLQLACQKKADLCSPICPICGRALSRVTHGLSRKIESRFGPIEIHRCRGWCKVCRLWFFPADLVLGLDKGVAASPSVQEAAALTVSKMPVADAQPVLHRLTGLDISQSTLDREARRQGEKARKIRERLDEKACDEKGRWEVTAGLRKELGPGAFTLVIEMDAWNIRERDQWGASGRGVDVNRWHWAYGATVFRLGDRIEKAGGRKVITSRGYVMTREGGDSFVRQVYGEAVRRGLLLAQHVLVIADGAVWIWKIVGDRFAQATMRLDYFHASEHLWAVANEIFGSASSEARAWVEPLLHQLKNGGHLKVLGSLEELVETVEASKKAVVERERNYFRTHKDRLDYKAGTDAGEPIGSGAMESTCRQYQCRFKRPGQFWSTTGDEALMALETLWRNGRWHALYPHSLFYEPSNN